MTVRGVRDARTELVDLEELSDEELETIQDEFRQLHDKLAHKIKVRREQSKN